jgi:signal transduction histidine kinase
VTADSATTEKVWLAERQIALVRLFVVVANTLVYLFLMEKAGTVPGLAYAIIVVAFLYTAWVLRAEPYRRYAFLASSYFTSAGDTLLLIAWIYATGARSSPFYLLLYISISAVAFRYGVRETVAAAVLYAASYLALLVALGQVAGHVAEIVVRLAYVPLIALLSALMSREILRQTRSRVEIAERLSRETRVAERRSRFLADATAILTRSLDWEEISARVARLIVPTLGDNCVVDLVTSDGGLRRMAEASADPGKEALLRELRAFPMNEAEGSPTRRALATGQTVFIPNFDEASLRSLDRNDAYGRIVRAIAPTSSVSIPLISRARTLGVLTYGMDASGRRHDPADLALAEELARHAALAIDNARLYRDAQEAITSRDRFISIASHELKTPLTTLRLQAEGLLRQMGPSRGALDPAAQARRLTTIVAQTARLDELVSQMLDVSRISAGRLDLNLQPIDLGAVTAEVVARFEDQLSRAAASVSVSVAGAPVVGCWDPMRVDQIVTNLVGNAIKYGAGRPIEVAVSAGEGRARLVVRDQGIGIDREQQGRLFHRFERLVGKDAPGGIGLGLWITRQFVEAMAGTISVESDLGRGSTFVVELPIARAGVT